MSPTPVPSAGHHSSRRVGTSTARTAATWHNLLSRDVVAAPSAQPDVGAPPHAPYSRSWCMHVFIYIYMSMYYGMHTVHNEINNILRTNISF